MKQKLFEHVNGNNFKVSTNESYLDKIGINKLMNRSTNSPTDVQWQDLEEGIEIIREKLMDLMNVAIEANTIQEYNKVNRLVNAILKIIEKREGKGVPPPNPSELG